ncbi:MAG: hypothetical protein J0L84_03305, partial [Verrucomicrobia bacterium]|nr:hypothetical protein [Verrucomicrobiota bacterium]
MHAATHHPSAKRLETQFSKLMKAADLHLQSLTTNTATTLRLFDNAGRIMELSAQADGAGFNVDAGGAAFGEFRYLEMAGIESRDNTPITIQVAGLELLWQITSSGDGSALPRRRAVNRPIPVDVSDTGDPSPNPKLVKNRKNRLHLWIKTPNFLLPLHIRANDRNHNQDGHFSWVGMTIWATSGGLYLGRLSLAAGNDTKDLLWFKEVKGWREFLLRRPLNLRDPLTFKTRPSSAAIGFVQPRFRLEAACETILGLGPLDGLRAVKYDDGREFYARWVETSSVYRLEFSRAFVTTDSTRVVGAEPGVIVRLFQTGTAPKSTALMQPWNLQAKIDGAEPVRGWWNHLIFGGNPVGIERSFAFELATVKGDKGAPESFEFDLIPEQERATNAWSFSVRPHLKAWEEYRRLLLRFPFLRDSDGKQLEVIALVKCEIKRRDGQEEGVTLRVKPSTTDAPAAVTRVVRFGSLDILFGGAIPANGTNDTGSDEFNVHVLVGSQPQAPGAGVIANWHVRSFQIGGAEVSTDPRSLPLESQMRLPVFSAYPGGVETSDRANELQSSRAGLILRLDPPKPKLTEPLLWLVIAERKDSSGASGLEIRIHRRQAAALSPLSAGQREKLFYFSWRPFLAALIRANRLEEFDLQRGAGELAYWSSQGIFEGWQGRAAAETAELVFPPQAMGEEMERLNGGGTEGDINEGELVDFRLSPPTILILRTSDVARNYAPMPWNVAGLLDDLRSNRLTGARVESANIELVYGFAMKLNDLRGIRLGELFARAGWPRRALPGRDPKKPGSTAAECYSAVRKDWGGILESYQSRLAIYELFDEQAVDFTEGGEPAGTVLFGKGSGARVTGYLRKEAHLGNSLDATPNDPLGLRGSFAWAFESKILFEALWRADTDPDPSTQKYIEATESTLARVFFSARGGWGSQEGKFDNGRTIIAAHVEMGRISEMRLERIGRLGVYWNKAKHVIVYRRSTLPTSQFEQAQDLHRGRPILRKAEEYVEFLESVRPFPDKQTVAQNDALPGCLCACSCHERIPVDSAWGSDIYYDNKPIGWKVPLYKTGAREDIYKPGNVHLHFHGNPASDTKELKCRIKNLQDLWFWTEARPDYNSNTEDWPAIPDVDLGRFSEYQEPDPEKLRAKIGSPAIPQGAGAFTWEIEPPIREANVVSHLSVAANGEASSGKPQIGSILRTVTVSRGAILKAELVDAGAGAAIREQVDNALFKLDQIKHTLGTLPPSDLPGARDTIEAIFDGLRTAGPVIQRAGAEYTSFANDLDQVADAQVRHRLKQNVDWTMTRFKSRFEAELQDRLNLIGNMAKYNELRQSATTAAGVLALAEFYIGEARATIRSIPESIDFFLAGLRGLINHLSTAAVAKAVEIAEEFIKRIQAQVDASKSRKELEEFISYLLSAERDMRDIHWWRGLTLKINLDIVVADLRKALDLIRSAKPGLGELHQITPLLQGVEAKAAQFVEQLKRIADQFPESATDLLKGELDGLLAAQSLVDFDERIRTINLRIRAALEAQTIA